MKKPLILIGLVVILVVSVFFVFKSGFIDQKAVTNVALDAALDKDPGEVANETTYPLPVDSDDPMVVQDPQEDSNVALANPASTFCMQNGGKVEIVTNKDGSQFGLCDLGDYSCEEWSYYRGECNVEKDAALIKQALIDKGLDLTGMKVVINKHLGTYIEGSVVPVDLLGGGGYVFAVKEEDAVKVLADGNGIISCESFEDYPDFSTYLVPSCVDANGNIIER